MAERWPQLLLLLAIAVALPAALIWLAEDAHESPTLVVASAPSVAPGPKPVWVPDVVGIVPGLREEIAMAKLKRLGFRVRVVEDPTADASVVGVTLGQHPSAGSKVPAGSEVTITVGG